ncbi:unnamed protein product [Lampetra planeri]
MEAPESPADETPAVEQRGAVQPAADDCRPTSVRLAELLGAVAELVAKLDAGQPSTEEPGPGPRGDADAAAAIRPRESPATPAGHAAAILKGTCREEAAIFPHPQAVQRDVPALHRRLPFLREFTAAGGDWEVFKRRFSTSCTLAGSTFLSLAQTAFPKLGPTGVDSLVMDRLLGLAKVLNVSLPASEDDDPTSLVIARCIQSHLGLKKRLGLVACATPEGETSEEDESAPVCASVLPSAKGGAIILHVYLPDQAPLVASASTAGGRIEAHDPLHAVGSCSSRRPPSSGAAVKRWTSTNRATPVGGATAAHLG